MKTPIQSTRLQNQRLALIFGAAFVTLLFTLQSWAFPISGVTFKDDAPFTGSSNTNTLTSSDGLVTIAGWSDFNATTPANLYQWWWIFGVNSGAGNGALIDGQESMTLQFDKSVGCSHIAFLYTGDPSGPEPITISGFLSDPGAYATIYNSPHISNLSYAAGTLSFDYLNDAGNDYGQLLFANPAASAGQTLKINYNGASGGAALFRVDSQELFGGPQLQPVSVKFNATNVYTTADGGLTVRGYSDRDALTPANFGTYVDQCFGVFGGNNGAVGTNESVTLQFANGFGLSRLDVIYSSAAQVSISGFQSDPGFTDSAGGSSGASYASGVLSFYPVDGNHHAYFFTNRAASAGQTLKITVDPTADNQVALASIGYANLRTVLGPDIPSNISPTYSTADGSLTLSAYTDTPGTVAANLYQNVDWFGIAGNGPNNEAIDGTESLNLQFSAAAGLSGLGMRYTWANIVLSGFASDPGFTDPSGMATSVSYADGTLSFHLESWRAPELVFNFANVAASAGRTLSLHTDGSSGTQISLSRLNYAATAAPVTLSIAKSGSGVVLAWPTGTLQASGSVTGPYTNVVGATSPYTNTVSGTQGYFRVKVQ
jgi:hypothetical protein